MSKRFTDTEIWGEDWFMALPPKYMLLFMYIKDTCDHAGIWKPKKKFLEMVLGEELNLSEAFELYNNGKERFIKLLNGRWLLPDFFVFQYGKSFNVNNKVHKSIRAVYDNNGVLLTSIRGLVEAKDRQPVPTKDPEKDDGDEKEKVKKHKYGEFDNVLLTDAEKEKLIADYGQEALDKAIAMYSPWKKEKAPKTKSDYLTMRRWVFAAVAERDKKDMFAKEW